MSLARGTYRIADEPIPGKLSRWVVNPLFPLLGGMLGGFGAGLLWFVVNGLGMGSATLRREVVVALAALSVVAAGVIAAQLTLADGAGATTIKLTLLGFQLVKLGALYALQFMQTRSFALHHYFGGQVANGIPLVVILTLARIQLLDHAPVLVGLVLL